MNTRLTFFLMKTIHLTLCAWFCITAAPLDAREPAKWVEQKNPALLPATEADGDSFGMTVASPTGKRVKRTYRLYGADCPESDEKDARIKERIKEQAEHFACPENEIPAWGKKATDFTNKLLSKGDPQVYTLGVMGDEVRKVKGRPQRYYALVEVTAQDGKRRMLHELLLEAGLARAYSDPAPWPEKEVKRLGKEKTEERFKRELEQMENKAKREKKGIWAGRTP